MKTASVLALVLSAPLALAHFTLDYPVSRGFDEDIEPNFCGGFNATESPRQLFPLSGGPILIDSHHPSAEVGIFISFDQTPTTFADFNKTSNGTAYGMLMGFGKITGQGEFCFQVDIAALGVAGVTTGTNATIQVEFNGGDGALFQCTDVTLSSTYMPTNVSCTNGTSTTTTSSNAASATYASSSATSASSTAKSAAAHVGASGALSLALGLVVGVAVLI